MRARSDDVPLSPGTERLAATYVVQPRASPVAESGRRRLAAKAPLVGRDTELAVLTQAVRATVAGRGGVVVVAGEPGLGKTRLVGECRNYFMGWVGAASGRLPLWLDGRCASYASSTPYGAYQQLLSRFIGAPLEAGETVLRPALEAAMRAVFGKDTEALPLLARMLGLPAGAGGAHPGADEPGGAPIHDVPSCEVGAGSPNRAWPDGARPGGPALVRPDFAPADRRAGHARFLRPLARAGDSAAGARARGWRAGGRAGRRPGPALSDVAAFSHTQGC